MKIGRQFTTRAKKIVAGSLHVSTGPPADVTNPTTKVQIITAANTRAAK